MLHLDAQALHRDGLHLGDFASLAGWFSSIALRSDVVCEDTTTRHDLASKLGRLAEQKRRFDVILVVGHSNSEGIRIGADLFVDWSTFAQFLKPFHPRRLLLVACQAGRWDAGEELFSRLPELRRIYACPANASKHFGVLMFAALPYIVANRRPRARDVKWGQFASIFLTGRQLREWRRTRDKGNPDAAWLDFVADATDPVTRSVPSVLKSLFRRRP
ncbi:hypothetical protein [Haliangium sp.]|uniref:hypothetical protein n=1 Tax=Haliangium sp. TaxID=2663208 RepID=UPI003D0F02EB